MNELSLLGAAKTEYPKTPEEAKLETFENGYPGNEYEVTFDCPEFTSVCPKTGQPDFAKIKIAYVPGKKCIESKSLKLYLFSFRNTGMFHEHIVNKILNELVAACDPSWMKVTGDMNVRGGIAITVSAQFSRPREDHA